MQIGSSLFHALSASAPPVQGPAAQPPAPARAAAPQPPAKPVAPAPQPQSFNPNAPRGTYLNIVA